MDSKTLASWLLLGAIVCLSACPPVASGFRLIRGRPVGKYGFLGLPVSNVSYYDSSIPAQWFDQRLDHFDPTNTDTWKQRYFVSMKYFDRNSDSPVFLQLGGEGEASPVWLEQGQVATNYAKHFKAAQVLIEHRYYGKSHPTSDMSTANLKYLTSEQALQDAASFIEFFKRKHNLSNNNKWIVFGGSYSGSLAAWLRLKYPHLISGAIASSAPVQAILNFDQYLKVVDASLGSQCVSEIRSAVNELGNLLSTSSRWKEINQLFQLCDPLDATKKLDVSNLVGNLAGNFEGVVQYNKDNRKFEGATGTNITIDVVCSAMTNVGGGSSIERFANVNSILLNANNLSCLDYKYDNFIQSLSEEKWNNASAGRLWTYQTCTEFGFFQSSDYPSQPFGNYFPSDFFVQQCVDIFGSKFNKHFIEKSIDFTNSFYGGFNLTLSNVLFPNGLIDPWHALGVLHPISPTAQPLIIPQTSHCADMYPDSDIDPQSLKEARLKIKNTIAKFLHEH
ncbi:PREDICTED: putative serine protease K12H4.7 [Rhagoletis zephyria]|uniref:putative serine protease K12H4.7 n=1 Tax=Rhagoletis zephyria TaxID=28612 RepID=UPI000811A4EC|nr:PREDICTED: putative serine protease K12H4.7 [Rhagoletis zephyria]